MAKAQAVKSANESPTDAGLGARLSVIEVGRRLARGGRGASYRAVMRKINEGVAIGKSGRRVFLRSGHDAAGIYVMLTDLIKFQADIEREYSRWFEQKNGRKAITNKPAAPAASSANKPARGRRGYLKTVLGVDPGSGGSGVEKAQGRVAPAAFGQRRRPLALSQ